MGLYVTFLFASWEQNKKKNALYLSVNVFSTKVLYGDTVFFYAKFIQRNCLMKFKKENEDFLDYKNIKLKTLQNSHFSEGLVHGLVKN